MENIFTTPIQKGNDVWIAPGARVLGRVSLGDECTILFGAVIRADNDIINIGSGSNVQDNAVIHVDPGFPVTIGKHCTVGHLAIIHGATLGNNVLVGMNATILNGAVIGDYCLIGANTLIPEHMVIPAGSLVVGTPARIVRQIDDSQKEKIRKNAEAYIALGKKYAADEQSLK